tara:strand:+ start:942 stop:1184 length:243 start_codon:yes stop_codon:yes gene_type:complete
MKVKVDKVEYEIKDITLAERCELNDLVIERADKPSFSMWVKVVQICTDLTDDQINDMESSQIIQLGSKCIDSVNKKKDKR